MELKVVCLNLWQGGMLFDSILEFLTQEDADLLLLQEVYDGTDDSLPRNYHSIEVLRQELNYPYFDFAPAMLDRVPEGKVENGNAVFSKYPITGRNAVFFDIPYREREAYNPEEWPVTPRNMEHVTVETPGGDINVFNFQGVWDLDGDNFSPQRQNMSKVIIEAVRGKSHVILAGDTNAKPTNPAMRAIEDHLTSVFGTELTTSFNMRRKDNPGYATACVDLMYISSDMRVIEKACPDVDISDHLPLVVKLALQ